MGQECSAPETRCGKICDDMDERCGMEKQDPLPTDPVELQSKWTRSVPQPPGEDDDDMPSSQHQSKVVDEGGVKPLHRAALLDDAMTVDGLIEHGGVEVNEADSSGRTALHAAAFGGSLSAARVLVMKHGANIHASSVDGKTPIVVAAEQRKAPVMRFLMAQAAAQKSAAAQPSPLAAPTVTAALKPINAPMTPTASSSASSVGHSSAQYSPHQHRSPPSGGPTPGVGVVPSPYRPWPPSLSRLSEPSGSSSGGALPGVVPPAAYATSSKLRFGGGPSWHRGPISALAVTSPDDLNLKSRSGSWLAAGPWQGGDGGGVHGHSDSDASATPGPTVSRFSLYKHGAPAPSPEAGSLNNNWKAPGPPGRSATDSHGQNSTPGGGVGPMVTAMENLNAGQTPADSDSASHSSSVRHPRGQVPDLARSPGLPLNGRDAASGSAPGAGGSPMSMKSGKGGGGGGTEGGGLKGGRPSANSNSVPASANSDEQQGAVEWARAVQLDSSEYSGGRSRSASASGGPGSMLGDEKQSLRGSEPPPPIKSPPRGFEGATAWRQESPGPPPGTVVQA